MVWLHLSTRRYTAPKEYQSLFNYLRHFWFTLRPKKMSEHQFTRRGGFCFIFGLLPGQFYSCVRPKLSQEISATEGGSSRERGGGRMGTGVGWGGGGIKRPELSTRSWLFRQAGHQTRTRPWTKKKKVCDLRLGRALVTHAPRARVSRPGPYNFQPLSASLMRSSIIIIIQLPPWALISWLLLLVVIAIWEVSAAARRAVRVSLTGFFFFVLTHLATVCLGSLRCCVSLRALPSSPPRNTGRSLVLLLLWLRAWWPLLETTADTAQHVGNLKLWQRAFLERPLKDEWPSGRPQRPTECVHSSGACCSAAARSWPCCKQQQDQLNVPYSWPRTILQECPVHLYHQNT